MIWDILQQINPALIGLVFLGATSGLLVGSIPGLSVTMATAILVTVTYSWTIENAMALIMGLYVAGVFSGAVSAILINIPGAPAAVITKLDGFPMTEKGEAAEALWIATFQSFIGSLVGLFLLAILAKPITNIALQFSPLDYFLIAVFGLTAVGALTAKDYTKGLISAIIGLFLSSIGREAIMGTARFSFGITNLQAGINLIAALIGLFGFTEVLTQIYRGSYSAIANKAGKVKPDFKGALKHLSLSIRSSIIGTFIGALPGCGGPVAALISYDSAKKTVKNPTRPFGEGAEEGIVASEAANNACVGGALIPMLTLGIPGDAVTAVILAAFLVHGLSPGPLLFSESPELFHLILAGGFIGSISMLILGITVVPRLSKVVLIPKKILLPVVSVLCVIGSYAVNNSIFDVLVMMIIGFLGFILKNYDYPIAPIVLALVLGDIMDPSFRRAFAYVPSIP
ncbi:MAG TPA: tripartite tricarboxylate transporter permease, partial [Halanaerobiales bacterium]|nr:tripartite tricarboxylate transporter permease [Halanaerobiales bacterium]